MLKSHLEGFLKVVLLLQEQSIIDDDLGSGYLEVNDPIVHCLSTLCSEDGPVRTQQLANYKVRVLIFEDMCVCVSVCVPPQRSRGSPPGQRTWTTL